MWWNDWGRREEALLIQWRNLWKSMGSNEQGRCKGIESMSWAAGKLPESDRRRRTARWFCLPSWNWGCGSAENCKRCRSGSRWCWPRDRRCGGKAKQTPRTPARCWPHRKGRREWNAGTSYRFAWRSLFKSFGRQKYQKNKTFACFLKEGLLIQKKDVLLQSHFEEDNCKS